MAKPSPWINLVAEYMTGEVSTPAFRTLAAALADASKDAPKPAKRAKAKGVNHD